MNLPPVSTTSTAGRYAPSPSGDLHLGNLRTALLAWLFARTSGRAFLMRVEDLDRVRDGAEQRQLDDLRRLGIDWDGPLIRQSEQLAHHDDAIRTLTEQGRTFECFCTRREILEAPSAPHLPPGAYPGTCRELTADQRAERARQRPPAVRLRAGAGEWTIHDLLHGDFTGGLDDVVLRRNDGVPAYNLAVVVDDAAQGVDQVVRGDDLLTSAPRQAHLAHLLGHPQPVYAHVPLVLNVQGRRLAKRDGAVTLRELHERGHDPLALITQSLGLPALSPADLLERFDPSSLPRTPWVFTPPA
ncbi:tRNA glutamyl-Q(34) synthetase GluQRS [Aeromicrobium sp. CTD01-1L150]|uniref:tRNA glutamyl-Q(34) synthetase GluQRS n=1 Tax=Aeromicrobium sp. CTD01-1L150 TaxID=3341830 RepID=UPI0035BF3516